MMMMMMMIYFGPSLDSRLAFKAEGALAERTSANLRRGSSFTPMLAVHVSGFRALEGDFRVQGFCGFRGPWFRGLGFVVLAV